MILADVIEELADRLRAITNIEVHPMPVGTVVPPAAVITYPDTVTFDETYGRGADDLTLEVHIVTGAMFDRDARDRLLAYANGAGDRSIKQRLEAGANVTFDVVRVASVEFEPTKIAGVDYMAAVFTIEIAGQGSS